jgi:hypothetical protein
MISRVTCTERQHQISVVYQRTWQLDLRLTTFALGKFFVTEGTIVKTLVTRQAIVVAFMEAVPNAMEVTFGALRLAELDASP